MPRRTQSGARAQPIAAVAGQTYGLGVEEMALQRQMPAPVGRAPIAATVAPQGPGGAAPPVPAQGQDAGLADALASVGGSVPPGGLMGAPTARPDEPVTHGLPMGPGGGPEVLGNLGGSQAGQWMRRLSMLTGNPYFAALADRAGQ